jgi:hypothetical protein
MQAPAVKDAFDKQGFNIVPSKSSEEAKGWIKGEMDAWKKITDEVKVDFTE